MNTQTRELPISTFAPPALMLPAEDYLQVVRECDRILAKIKQLRQDFENQFPKPVPSSVLQPQPPRHLDCVGGKNCKASIETIQPA